MANNKKKAVSREEVDISKESSELATYSPGSLDEIDEHHRILARWFREKTLVWLSVAVIGAVLLTGIGILVLSVDEASRDWGRQILSMLVGFAAGAIWPTSKNADGG